MCCDYRVPAELPADSEILDLNTQSTDEDHATGDQRRRRTVDVDDVQLRVGAPEDHAAGLKAVTVSAKRTLERMGPARTARAWLKLNRADGFDCMSCA